VCDAFSIVRATLYLEIASGSGDAFVEAWREIAQQVKREPGNLRQTLLREGESSFVIESDWTSREAFTAFERSERQDELTEPIRRLRQSARMIVYEIVADVDGA
jgi:heme-degrading monooxygenase HmoA